MNVILSILVDERTFFKPYEVKALKGREIKAFKVLFNKLSCVMLDYEVNDKLIWKPNSNRVYSVKSTCGLLSPSSQINLCNSFNGI
ncbi:hypothetical protein Peur_026604 [Populus x canadensis]